MFFATAATVATSSPAAAAASFAAQPASPASSQAWRNAGLAAPSAAAPASVARMSVRHIFIFCNCKLACTCHLLPGSTVSDNARVWSRVLSLLQGEMETRHASRLLDYFMAFS